MNKTDLREIIGNGENSGVEFKRDDVVNHELAKEIVSFLNLDGGIVLLGVNDNGTITGIGRKNSMAWITELCRVKIEPPVIPFLSRIQNVEAGKDVLVVQVSCGPDKPYARLHNDRHTYFIRVGSSCREASQAEVERLFQASGRVQYGLKPVSGTSLADLDGQRLRDYFGRILRGKFPGDEDSETWETLLCNMGLMVQSAGRVASTVDGLLLFGRKPKRFLPQAGIRAIACPGVTANYPTYTDQELTSPLLPLCSSDGKVIETGLVEEALDFVRRNTDPSARLEGGRRIDRTTYPEEVVREVVVNALMHRDYSIAGVDVTLALYADRLEVQSPGRLPSTVTINGMMSGFRYARNQTLVNVMKDYRYVDFRGMGVRDKVIPGMRAHNGTEPDLIEEENRFIVRLWKASAAP